MSTNFIVEAVMAGLMLTCQCRHF